MGHASACPRIKDDFFFLLGCLCTGHFSSQTEDIAAVHAVRPAGAPPVTFPWRIPRGPRRLPSGSRLAACPGHVLSVAPVCGPRFLCLRWRPAYRTVPRRDTGCSFTDRVSENARHSHQTRLGGASCAGGPPCCPGDCQPRRPELHSASCLFPQEQQGSRGQLCHHHGAQPLRPRGHGAPQELQPHSALPQVRLWLLPERTREDAGPGARRGSTRAWCGAGTRWGPAEKATATCAVGPLAESRELSAELGQATQGSPAHVTPRTSPRARRPACSPRAGPLVPEAPPAPGPVTPEILSPFHCGQPETLGAIGWALWGMGGSGDGPASEDGSRPLRPPQS